MSITKEIRVEGLEEPSTDELYYVTILDFDAGVDRYVFTKSELLEAVLLLTGVSIVVTKGE